jgi:hypothetical protein
MAIGLMPKVKQQFFDNNGNPLTSGLLYSYIAGTTTPVDTYTDVNGSTANTNPVILDARGEADVWISTAFAYKFKLTYPDTSEIWTVDDVSITSGGSNSSELVSFFSQVFTEADLSVDRKLTITHNLDSEDLIINLFDDGKKVYLPDEYQVIDVNNVEVTIDATVVGTNKIVICGNANSGSQTTPSVGGFMDYNDTSTTSTPINLARDTWTTIPNDGLGAFTNKAYRPDGNSIELIDTATGAIDTTGLALGDTILIRNDFTVVPNTNNASLLFRYQLGSGAGSYTLEKRLGRLDEGSGSPYRFSLSPDLIYMGDTNTRDNPISLQVKLSTDGTLVNAGSVIQLISYHRA